MDRLDGSSSGHHLEWIDEVKAFVATYGQSPPTMVRSCVLTHKPSGVQELGVATVTIYCSPTIATTN
jgi:hypothetical protein